jgi:hypothetical protein
MDIPTGFGSSLSLCRRAIVLAIFGMLALVASSSADTFDAPLKKQVVDFGLSASNLPGGRNFRVKLYCWSYPAFMIKELDDEGEKGAQWTSIVPIRGAAIPPCDRAHAGGETLIEPEWGGYFHGVEGNLVFIDADDGTDGGMPFVVFDFRTRKKIFEDSAYTSRMWRAATHSPFDEMRVRAAPNEGVLLTYLRVVEADCDLHLEGHACWEKVREKLALKSDRPPVCSGYEKISSRWVSAVAYPVEVSLFPQPSTKTIAGPVKCRPVD